MFERKNSGWIELICGSMFSGKSEELIRRIRRAMYANLNVLCFKPKIDDRYEADAIVSHNGRQINAIALEKIDEMLTYLDAGKLPHLIAIDEAQFFSDEIVPIVRALADKDVQVILAGLDTDFRGEPFGPMQYLLPISDAIVKLTAICSVCGAQATRTQRLINGVPASYHDPTVLVGARESYEARCRLHHEVSNKPKTIYDAILQEES